MRSRGATIWQKAALLDSVDASRARSAGRRRETLLDFFDDAYASRKEFLVFDDGYRTWSYTYDQVRGAAHTFAARLRRERIGKGDKIILWSENRPEWIVALWGALSQGVIVVPIDYRSSADPVRRIRDIVRPHAVLVGEDVSWAMPPGDGAGDVPVWRLAEFDWTMSATPPDRVAIDPGDTAEIIFTSGATADPKGVILTHRNILANLVPIEREVAKYRLLARPFAPVRFLNLLPLSHMFGQAMTALMPPMLTGVVVLMRGYRSREIVRQLRTRRISVLVCVPKILDVLREHVIQQVPDAQAAIQREEARVSVTRRLWRYRQVHQHLGWKFWSFVVGAAPLERDLEEFWSRLGYVVVQGYGLTETAPVISVNHPFKPGRGTVGAPIAGVEVKIAPDGEILVRGENVTPGYIQAERETTAAFENGWLHTGDIGELDQSGRLIIRGRKKEMIVTPEGLNVFPEDVERVLNDLPGVHESAAVGITRAGEERVHAVLVLEPGIDQADVVRQANARLEDHQKIRSASVWTSEALPRTEGTRKLKRRELQRWAGTGGVPADRARPPVERTVAAIVSELAHREGVTAGTTLDELGLSSLERIELMTSLEDEFGTTIDEADFSIARTVGDLESLVRQDVRVMPAAAPLAVPARRTDTVSGVEPAVGDLVSDDFSILIFPEGHISHGGDLLPFQPGIGMLGSRLNVPVVPIRLDGIDRVLHPTWRMARPGWVTVTFGKPISLQGQDYAALAKQVEEAVKAL